MPLSEVLHQEGPQRYVQQALRSGRLPHALIFAGPDGVGKRMFAERLAALLLCETPSKSKEAVDACGACVNCELSRAGTHPDFHVVHRLLAKFHPSDTVRRRKATQLGIDVIRHFLIGPVGMRPSHASHKVFVVNEAELMNAEAQNATLKTLEEPPNNSHLILIAKSADAMLETIRSRCQTIQFASLPTAFVREKLAEAQGGLSDDQAHFISEMTDGSIGRAVWLASIGIQDMVSDAAAMILEAQRDPVAAAATASDAAKSLSEKIKTGDDLDDGVDTNLQRLGQTTQIALLTALLRECMRLSVGLEPAPLLPDSLRGAAAGATTAHIAAAIRSLNTADFYVGRSANTNLIFDSIGIALRRAFERQTAA
ncbi:MAG TPA: DNA polymerase III subunit [Phycisphaerae bacterium]|nr:DNA polymerase III subunit [Phycisphaerae bacterium]HRW52602.1 DNA polymerase III subunit [Phycisphaerae bacterium]